MMSARQETNISQNNTNHIVTTIPLKNIQRESASKLSQ